MNAQARDRNPYEPPTTTATPSRRPQGSSWVRRLIYFHLAALVLAAAIGAEGHWIGLSPILDGLVMPIIGLGSLAMVWIWPVVVLIALMRSKLSLGVGVGVFAVDCLISGFQMFLMLPAFQ